MKIILLIINLLSFTFVYSQRLPLSDVVVNSNVYSLNYNTYTGNIYELYKSGQLKSEYEVNDGKKHGTENIYFIENSYSNDSYKDTLVVMSLRNDLGSLELEISQLKEDSTREGGIASDIKYVELGIKKFYKYKGKYREGKLKKEKLTIFKRYVQSNNKFENSTQKLKNTSPIRDSLELKLNEEENKPFYKNQLEETYTYHEGNQTGLHQKYDESKIVLLEEELKDGVRNGSYKRYENGKIKEEGTYLNDKKNGEWTFYNQNILFEIVNFKDGEKSGVYKKYNGDVVIKEGGYQNGLKGGEWKEFDDSGNITLESAYLNDTLNGVYKKYNGEVVIKEGQYTSGLMNGEWVFRYDKGKKQGVGQYIDGVNKGSSGIPKNGRDGDWVMFFENGRKSQVGSYMNGLPEGKWSFYHEWSKPKESKQHEGTYVNGLPEGEWKEYDRSGKLISATTYRKGKVNGPYKKYFGGVIIAQGNYSHLRPINGLMNGQWTFRHTNGKRKGKGEYVNGDGGNKGIDGVPKNGRIGNWKTIGEREEEALIEIAKELIALKIQLDNLRNSSSDYDNYDSQSSSSESSSSNSCSLCQGTGKCYDCSKPQRLHYYRNGWQNDNETRLGKTVCSDCRGDGIVKEHISNGKMDRYEKCYVGTCNNGWQKCRRCYGDGECDRCHGKGTRD